LCYGGRHTVVSRVFGTRSRRLASHKAVRVGGGSREERETGSYHPPSHLTDDGYRVWCRAPSVVIGTAGMQADTARLHNVIQTNMTVYEHSHRRVMRLGAIAQMLSVLLYQRRFFPYYTFNVIGGIDEHGEGFVYGYDAIGSHERVKVVCTGSAQSQIQPVLDNQVEFKQQYGSQKRDLSLEETVDLVKDVFSSACERDIYTGDFLEIYKITKAGSEMERFELKLD